MAFVSLRRRRWGQKQYGEVTKVAIWYTILLEKLVNIAVFTQAMLCHSIWNMARHKYSSMSFFFACRKNEAFYHMESSIKNYRDKPKDFGAAPLPPEKKRVSFFVAPLRNFSVKEAAFLTFIYLDPGGRGSLLLCKVLLYTIANCSGSTCCCIYFLAFRRIVFLPKLPDSTLLFFDLVSISLMRKRKLSNNRANKAYCCLPWWW